MLSGQVTSQRGLKPPLSHNCFLGGRPQKGEMTNEHQNRVARDLLLLRFGRVQRRIDNPIESHQRPRLVTTEPPLSHHHAPA